MVMVVFVAHCHVRLVVVVEIVRVARSQVKIE